MILQKIAPQVVSSVTDAYTFATAGNWTCLGVLSSVLQHLGHEWHLYFLFMLVVMAYCLAKYRCRWVRRYRTASRDSSDVGVREEVTRDGEGEASAAPLPIPTEERREGDSASASRASPHSHSAVHTGFSGHETIASKNDSIVSASSADYSPHVTRRAARLSHVPQLKGIHSNNTDSEADDERTPRRKKCVSFVEGEVKAIDVGVNMEKETVMEKGTPVDQEGPQTPRKSGRKRRLPMWLRGDDVVLT